MRTSILPLTICTNSIDNPKIPIFSPCPALMHLSGLEFEYIDIVKIIVKNDIGKLFAKLYSSYDQFGNKKNYQTNNLYEIKDTFVEKKSASIYDFIMKRKYYNLEIAQYECSFFHHYNHKNIVKGYMCLKNTEIGVYFVIMEYLPIQLKEEHFVENKVRKVLKIAIDVSNALYYMHYNNYLHNNITVDNILGVCANEQVVYKLIDFGTSFPLDSDIVCQNYLGSELYMAPETKFKKQLTKKTDVWQVGMVIYRLMMKFYSEQCSKKLQKAPEDAENAEKYSLNIKKRYKGCELEALLDKLLIFEPNDRPDANQMLLLLKEELRKLNENLSN